MSHLEALAEEEGHRRATVEQQCDRLAAALAEYRFGVHYDRTVTTNDVHRRFTALEESEHLWQVAKLARLNAEAAWRNEARNAG